MKLKVFLKEYSDTFLVGWYEDEWKSGTPLTISIWVELNYQHSAQLDQTFNYEKLIHLVQSLKNVQLKLLEDLASLIIKEISTSPLAENIKVEINKISMPVQGYSAKSCGIEMFWSK